MSKTDELIILYAGKRSDDWIASEAGVTTGALRNRASELGISLGVPKATSPKRQYWMSAPGGRQQEIADKIEDLMRHYHLWSQSATMLRCIEEAHERMLKEEE